MDAGSEERQGTEVSPRTMERISLAWWNAGLAPLGVSRGSPERYDVASRVLRSLVVDESVALLALGETTDADLEACCASASELRRLEWRKPGGRRQRASALAVGYDARVLTLLDDSLLTDTFGGTTFATGWHLVFEAFASGDALNVVVVHWPSHVREDAAIQRQWIATSLHSRFREDRDVVLLGDFNDEPFSPALSHGLVAYRDRELVRRRGDAYYNPFWRHLGEQQILEHEETGSLPAGTHFHHSGTASRWFTFDQIVVSSGLLGNSAWRLLEGTTRVVTHESLLTPRGTMRDVFDHLPVATSLRYSEEALNG